LLVELLERLAHRLHQLVDRLLATLQLAFGGLLVLRERLLCEVDERLVVALQRFRRERAECLSEVLARPLDLRELPGRRLALQPERRGEALGPAVQLGDRGAGLVEPRGLSGELRARLAELALGGPGAIGELGARDLEPSAACSGRRRAGGSPAARSRSPRGRGRRRTRRGRRSAARSASLEYSERVAHCASLST
jgi:hypothetical protein